MIIDAAARDDARELRELAHLARSVLTRCAAWLDDDRLDDDLALALVQNALPLTEGAAELSRLQRRSHARVLAALLLLLDEPGAGGLATGLVETLLAGAPRDRVLAS